MKVKLLLVFGCVLAGCLCAALSTLPNHPTRFKVEDIPASEMDVIVRTARKGLRGGEVAYIRYLINNFQFKDAALQVYHYYQCKMRKIELQRPNLIVVTFSCGTNMDWSHLNFNREKSGLTPGGGDIGN